MRLHGYVYFKTAIKRLVLPSSGTNPYYIIILFRFGKNAYMKHKYKRSQLGTEFDRSLRLFKYFLPICRSQL